MQAVCKVVPDLGQMGAERFPCTEPVAQTGSVGSWCLAGQWDGLGGFANSVVPDAKFIA